MSLDPTLDPRLAGNLRRYHAWPVLRDQTVADHSWQVARILLAIYPECPRHVVVAALMHDVGEWGGPGDVPFGAKRRSAVLAKEADRQERDAHLAMCLPWGLPAPPALGSVDEWAVKLADLIEMWEKGREEVLLGNQFAMLIVERTEDVVRGMTSEQTDDETRTAIVRGVWNYMGRRRAAWPVK